MRNRTAVQLLYILAVLAGLLPPILFLGYAFRQSAVQVERDLDFLGTGSLVRAENVLDSVASTLRKVVSLAQGEITAETVSTLRQAVFLNRFIQAIRIREGDASIASSEDGLDPKVTLIGTDIGPLPAPGEFTIRPPTAQSLSDSSIKVCFGYSENRAVEGLIDPAIFNEFFDYYAHELGSRVFVLFGDAEVLTSFGKPHISFPSSLTIEKLGAVQWRDGAIARVAASQRYPLERWR